MNILISLLRMKEIFALPMLKILAAFSQEAEKYICFKKDKRLSAGMLSSYQHNSPVLLKTVPTVCLEVLFKISVCYVITDFLQLSRTECTTAVTLVCSCS